MRTLLQHLRSGVILAAPLIAASVALQPLPAVAHGGLSLDEDQCKLTIGPYSMHFTGYQPEATGPIEFCEDIPRVGHTVVVLDAVNKELRTMPIEVRIVRDTGDESDLAAITVLHLPAARYPSGSLTFEHTFGRPGKFVGIVSVTAGDGNQIVSRFPFSVGTGASGMNKYLVAAALLVGATVLGLYWKTMRAKQASGRNAGGGT